MASVGAIWGPPTLRLLRIVVARTSKAVRTKLADVARPLQGEVQLIPVRSGYTGRQPIHPAALLKQTKRGGKWNSSGLYERIDHFSQRFFSSKGLSPAERAHASRFPKSATGQRVARSGGRAPWANALRPNLTGGAMPRTAGGYSLGGGARYFSHTPAAPAQVMQNVSQAMRAFFLSGQKLRYDGVDGRGNQQFRAVSHLEDEAMSKLADIPRNAPGAFIDFHLSPTLTALGPLASMIPSSASSTAASSMQGDASPTLDADNFLAFLAADFERAAKELPIILSDLQRLSILGNLPIEMTSRSIIRVRFPGVDAATVQDLCDDIGIQRGVISQDPDFDSSVGVSMALKFPYAPASAGTLTSPGGSARSIQSHEEETLSSLGDDSYTQDMFLQHLDENLSEPSSEGIFSTPLRSTSERANEMSGSYEGVEGIYRFLEECNNGPGRFR